jgi:hypothetical protein
VTWSHPEWWVVVAAAAAWAGLAYLQWTPAGGPTGHHAHDTPGYSVLGTAVATAALMGAAMMAPLVLPTLRRISLTSLWRRRHRAQLLFLTGYLATWTAAIVATEGLVAGAGNLLGRMPAIALATAGAAAWQFAPSKRRALRRCARSVPIPPRGWRADVHCLRFGASSVRSCAVTCLPMMVTLVAAGHALVPMLALSAVQLHERIVSDYRPAAGALVIAVVGAGAALVPGVL